MSQKGSETDNSWLNEWVSSAEACNGRSYLEHSLSDITTFHSVWLWISVLQIKVGQWRRESPRPRDLSWATPSLYKQKNVSSTCVHVTILVPAWLWVCMCLLTRTQDGEVESHTISSQTFTQSVCWLLPTPSFNFFNNIKRRNNTNLGPDAFSIFCTDTWSRLNCLTCVLSPPPSLFVLDGSLFLCSVFWVDSTGQLI